MEAEQVSLIALWGWHFPWQPELTMTSATYPDLVKLAAVFNRAHGATAGANVLSAELYQPEP